MASSDQVVIRYAEETVIGVGDASPELSRVRFLTESLNYSIENVVSAQADPGRFDQDLVQTGGSVAGDFNIEFSFGSYDDWLAALFGRAAFVTSTGDQSRLNGHQSTMRTFTIWKNFVGTADPEFHKFVGCAIDGFQFKAEIGKIVEGSFSIVGFGNTTQNTNPAGATFLNPYTTPPFNGATNFQNFQIDDVPYTACLSSIGIQIKNNIRANRCLGSLFAKEMKFGTFQVTGDMELYFSEGTIYNKFVAGTEFPVQFDLVDSDGNKYTFRMARCKFESVEVVAGGKDTDVMFSGKFRALRSDEDNTVMRITRDPSAGFIVPLEEELPES